MASYACDNAVYVLENGRKVIQCRRGRRKESCSVNDFMQINGNIITVSFQDDNNNTKKVEFICENNTAAVMFTEQLRMIICGMAIMDLDFLDVLEFFRNIQYGKFYFLEESKEKLLYCLKEKFKNNSLKNVMIGLSGGNNIGMLIQNKIMEEIHNTLVCDNGIILCSIYGENYGSNYDELPEDVIRISLWYEEADSL